MEAVRRSLFVGILIGLVLGAIVGILMATVYVWQNPPVYEGGAYPSELTDAYQKHYLAMVVDSYIVNQEPGVAKERLKTFDSRTQILVLGERSAAYVAAGRGAEAQAINSLATNLKSIEGWNEETIKDVVGELAAKYQNDPARAQAIGTFSAQMLGGLVPEAPPAQPPAGEAAEPAPAEPAAPAAPPAAAGGYSWVTYLLCCLLFLVLLAIMYIIGRRRFEARRRPTKQDIVWEGEGPAPIKVWSGTYTLGQDMYDEFATIETDDDDFLGEFGMGILEAIPNTSPKQVVAFDVGLFDKTDITTLSRAVMSEYAYNDETIRAKIEANPQAEAILAEPGKKFSFETSALRVDATIDDMAYAEGGNTYFEKLTVSLNLFLK
ncbi:MAG: hypothetical protein D6768_10165, partial [Chloroflexi bacterium]